MIIKIGIFQSTPSVWRETNEKYKVLDDEIISIHSLRVEGDKMDGSGIYQHIRFQSTPSVWRETRIMCLNYLSFKFQSTPSVWRETQNGDTTC